MSVDHFEDDYDEALPAHLTAEFGTDIATVLCETRELSVPLCTAVADAARDAHERRRIVHDGIENEIASVRDARTELERIATTIHRLLSDTARELDVLFERHEVIGDLTAECDRVLQRRQAGLRDATLGRRDELDGHDWCAYLYERHEWTYPVLADLADLVLCLQDERSRLEAHISRIDNG